jgi:acetamidase/formamidase
MKQHTLHADRHHFHWDNQLPAALELEPGDEVELAIIDASDGQIRRDSSAADLGRLDFSRVNPVSGPITVRGAEPGDALVVDILELELGEWGWTGIIPGFGLLASDFPDAFLLISRYDASGIEFLPGVRVPTRPFIGTIGVAPAAPGQHSVIPPRRVGGNLDCRDMLRGTRAYFPVEVSGGKLSVGDTHAAQGDGEVCGTAIETALRVRLRVGLEKQRPLRYPQLEVPEVAPSGPAPCGSFVTLGIGPDLLVAARDAIREMIDHLMKEYGLSAEQSYCLCSVAVHLRLSEVVDAPNWVVSAYLPNSLFPRRKR